jgi:hypothetical protein
VNEDLIFGLLAPGYEVDRRVLSVIKEAYDDDHGFHVYPDIDELERRSVKWRPKHPMKPPSLNAEQEGTVGD